MNKHRVSYILNWVSSNFCCNCVKPSKSHVSFFITQNPRFYSSKVVAEAGHRIDSNVTNYLEKKIRGKISPFAVREAQDSLLEYLHWTRSLQFLVAEHMSRNSPIFVEKLLQKIQNDDDESIGRSIARFLRYNPINEFEPFFESLGLKPCEYSVLLPKNLMFLNDDGQLLVNYNVLFTYGFSNDSIGMICRDAYEIFRYESGVLVSKLRSFEKIGFPQSDVIKIIAASPSLLSSKVFLRVLEKLKNIGFDTKWVEGHLLEGISYNWEHILELLCLFSKIGCNNDQLRGMFNHTPGLLFNKSGTKTFSIIAFLMKFGATKDDLSSTFTNIHQLDLNKYYLNIMQCYSLFVKLEMDREEIGKLVCSHTNLLGSCRLRKIYSLLNNLTSSKKQICRIIIKNPEVLRSWVVGSKIKRLPSIREANNILEEKSKFLIGLGFTENSTEFKKLLTFLRGKAVELQERFDYLINAGLKRSDILAMIKLSPRILNMRKEMIETKIDILVNELGYPVTKLLSFPKYISYTVERVNLRCSMYNWLIDERNVAPDLALSTIICCADSKFIRLYVNSHPDGLLVWENFKKQIYSRHLTRPPLGFRSVISSKPRIRWTQDLHDRFVECVNRLGGVDSNTKGNFEADGFSRVDNFSCKESLTELQKYKIAKYIPDSTGRKRRLKNSHGYVAHINIKTRSLQIGSSTIATPSTKTPS